MITNEQETALPTEPASVPGRSALARGLLAADAAIRRGVRTHAVFLVVFSVAAILRVIVLITYRPALLFYGDSYMYANNARHLVPKFRHPLGYPIFIWPWVHSHLISAVPIIQHGLGLGVGVALYALLRRLGAGAWATLGAAPILFDGYQLSLEQFLMGETLFIALVVVAFVVVCWRKRPSILASAGAALAIAAAAITRDVGVVLIVPLLVYLVVRRARVVAVLAAVCAFAVPLALYASWFQSVYGRYELTGFDGYYLYGRVAIFAECSKLGPLPGDTRILCDPRPPADRPSLNSYLSAPPETRLAAPPGVDRSSVLQSFAIRVITHEPGAYARVVLHDMTHYFSPFRITGRQDYPVQKWQFPDTFRVFAASPGPKGIVGPAKVPTRPGAPASFLGAYQRHVYTPGPLLLLAVILGCVGLLGLPRGARRRLRAECFLFTSSGIAVLLVPAMTAMFDFRFLLPALALLPPAGVLGGRVLVRRLRGAVAGAPSSQGETAPAPLRGRVPERSR
jgi:hypothetical protein